MFRFVEFCLGSLCNMGILLSLFFLKLFNLVLLSFLLIEGKIWKIRVSYLINEFMILNFFNIKRLVSLVK